MDDRGINVVAQFVSDLQTPISHLRLESYRPSDGSDLEMVTNYFWDMELSRAITPALHAVEVALRHSVHENLTIHFGTDLWFCLPGVLEPGQLGQLAGGLTAISRRKATPTSGRIVAELSFGFWSTLLTGKYEQRLWQPNGFAMLQAVFPHAGGQSIQHIQQHYNGLRTLRNRVSHYEAIWDRRNLGQDHADVLTGVAWISQPLHDAVVAFSNFASIYANGTGHQAMEARLKNHIGDP